jgi:hypothetical protein
MAVFENLYARKIYEIVSPVLGDMMTKGALRSQCKKIGISEESIEYKHLNLLSENIGKAMILFIGTEKARVITNKIKTL